MKLIVNKNVSTNLYDIGSIQTINAIRPANTSLWLYNSTIFLIEETMSLHIFWNLIHQDGEFVIAHASTLFVEIKRHVPMYIT